MQAADSAQRMPSRAALTIPAGITGAFAARKESRRIRVLQGSTVTRNSQGSAGSSFEANEQGFFGHITGRFFEAEGHPIGKQAI